MANEIEDGEIEQDQREIIIEDDDEIEQHLLARINHAIDHQGDKQLQLPNDVKSDFKELINMLKNKEPNKIKTPKVKPENWSSVRREYLYYLNNLLSDWQLTKNNSSFSPKAMVQNSTDNIKKSLKKMKKDLKGDPSETDPNLDESSHHQEPNHPLFERNKSEVYRWSSRHKPRNVYGFQHMVMAMERELVLHKPNEPFKVFGVVGVAGIGKTTLCQDFFNDDLVKKHFSPRIWVCLSKQPNARKNYNEEIVVRILKCLGMEDEIIGVENENDPYLLKRLILLLRLQLVGKRFLLVLDDAWKDDPKDPFFLNLHQKEQLPDKWGEELAYGLPKGCGGTIISSSRSSDLVKKMLGYHVSLQHIKPHTEENIEKIFDETVRGYDEDVKEIGPQLTELKKAILKKCDGIPLAAKLLAKIARDNLPPPKAKTVAAGAGHEIKPAGVAARGTGELVQGGDAGVSGGQDGPKH
ncbi:probable disease resistance protein [Tanacetum coccineum]